MLLYIYLYMHIYMCVSAVFLDMSPHIYIICTFDPWAHVELPQSRLHWDQATPLDLGLQNGSEKKITTLEAAHTTHVIFIYTHTLYIHIYIYICHSLSIYIYVYMYVCICICMYAYVYTCVYMRRYIYIHWVVHRPKLNSYACLRVNS